MTHNLPFLTGSALRLPCSARQYLLLLCIVVNYQFYTDTLTVVWPCVAVAVCPARRREWGGGVPLPSRLEGLGESRKLPQWGPGRSSSQKQFSVHFELEKTPSAG